MVFAKIAITILIGAYVYDAIREISIYGFNQPYSRLSDISMSALVFTFILVLLHWATKFGFLALCFAMFVSIYDVASYGLLEHMKLFDRGGLFDISLIAIALLATLFFLLRSRGTETEEL